ncbi:MAG: glycosyl hydrolase, partial [Planctomycetaceae bacterium]|nr:glycosyl hydrolase [Planctomycetaceae bacterium]
VYVGMGEHAVRGVMTSHGDGVYKSTDAGRTWKHVGLPDSRHIAAIRIHPQNSEHVYVAVQGALFGPSKDRGVYRSTDGGANWEQILFVNDTTGAADLSMDATNPRILYAGMWDHQRTPWQIRSGGKGSGIHKSTDGGQTWKKLSKGLPKSMGKVAVDVSPANPDVLYANIEAKNDKGGVYRSDDGGAAWKQVNSDRTTVARAWYYIEIFADPMNENQVYVLNAPMLKSIDGGKSFVSIPNPHTDQHDLWINPQRPDNMILANDGGGCVTFNGGKSWSPQNNQPTAQFYRVIADNQFPYRLYAGQQDNSTVSMASRSLRGQISERDWFPTAGGESAFLAFDPDNPSTVFGTSIQGIMSKHDVKTDHNKSIVAYPQLNLGTLAKDQKYRFNWNGPLTMQSQDPSVLYHGGNVLFRSDDAGHRWTEISGDLTRNEAEKHGDGSTPFTNEAAGGEVYNTISYIAASPHAAGEIWVGTDDGLVHRTMDEGKTWNNVTPNGLPESLINAIDISPHDKDTAFIAATRYKFNELRPMAYRTVDGGKSWSSIVHGIADDHFVRVVRQDPKNEQVLYAGTEGGLYISFDRGANWQPFPSNLPVCPITDLTFQDNDLIVATSGRAFWILDDLGAIQQTTGKLNESDFKVFQPKASYRFAEGGGKATPYAGANPAPGVIFDYQLPDSWKQDDKLTLRVVRGDGVVVRTIDSSDKSKTKTWTGGPTAATKMPAKAGLNRFHWDLRTDPIPGVKNIFMMGSHAGPRVGPGEYTLQLSAAEKGLEPVETKAIVLADPRIEASDEDHAAQQKALEDIRAIVTDVHQSVNQFRSVKSQLSKRLALLKTMEDQIELVELAKS